MHHPCLSHNYVAAAADTSGVNTASISPTSCLRKVFAAVPGDELLFTAISSYEFSGPWLLSQLPVLLQPAEGGVVILTERDLASLAQGDFVRSGAAVADTRAAATSSARRGYHFCAPRHAPFGCNHTKFIIGFYRSRVRVWVTSGNLVPADTDFKAETVWWQDFPRRLVGGASSGHAASTFPVVGSVSDFGETLLFYATSLVEAMPPGVPETDGLRDFTSRLREFDFSAASVAMVVSISGSPSSPSHHLCGHARLRFLAQREREWRLRQAEAGPAAAGPTMKQQLLRWAGLGYNPRSGALATVVPVAAAVVSSSSCNVSNTASKGSAAAGAGGPAPAFRCIKPRLMVQCSSLGSLSEHWMHRQLLDSCDPFRSSDAAEFARLSGAAPDALAALSAASASAAAEADAIEIVLPSVTMVRDSLEGFGGGGSIPIRDKNLAKPFLPRMLRRYDAAPSGRQLLCPHIKTMFMWASLVLPPVDAAATGAGGSSGSDTSADVGCKAARRGDAGGVASAAAVPGKRQRLGPTEETEEVICIDDDDDDDNRIAAVRSAAAPCASSAALVAAEPAGTTVAWMRRVPAFPFYYTGSHNLSVAAWGNAVLPAAAKPTTSSSLGASSGSSGSAAISSISMLSFEMGVVALPSLCDAFLRNGTRQSLQGGGGSGILLGGGGIGGGATATSMVSGTVSASVAAGIAARARAAQSAAAAAASTFSSSASASAGPAAASTIELPCPSVPGVPASARAPPTTASLSAAAAAAHVVFVPSWALSRMHPVVRAAVTAPGAVPRLVGVPVPYLVPAAPYRPAQAHGAGTGARADLANTPWTLEAGRAAFDEELASAF